jgi:polyphenol oxidase
MIPEMILPEIFDGLPVHAVFTTRAYQGETNDLIRHLTAEALYLPVQKHTGRVVIIDRDLEPVDADAVLTARRKLAVGVRTADCVPIILYDRRKEIAGAVHAGWRGSVQGIIRNTIIALRENFQSAPEDIIMAIGPAIRGTCYAVGQYVAEALTTITGEGSYLFEAEGKICADLPEANRLQAISEGILPANIWMSDECTHCLPEKYHSYRYSGGAPGRQYACISLD